MSSLFKALDKTERFGSIFLLFDRLNEYAPAYFDLTTFPNGEMKRALERAKSKSKAQNGRKKNSKVKAQLQKKDGSDNPL